MAKLILDVASEGEELEKYLKKVDSKFHVKSKIIEENGLSGFPEVKFTGTKGQLRKFYYDYAGEDDVDSFEEFYEQDN